MPTPHDFFRLCNPSQGPLSDSQSHPDAILYRRYGFGYKRVATLGELVDCWEKHHSETEPSPAAKDLASAGLEAITNNLGLLLKVMSPDYAAVETLKLELEAARRENMRLKLKLSRIDSALRSSP